MPVVMSLVRHDLTLPVSLCYFAETFDLIGLFHPRNTRDIFMIFSWRIQYS